MPEWRRRPALQRVIAAASVVLAAVCLAAGPANAAEQPSAPVTAPRLETITIPDSSKTIAPWTFYGGTPRANVLLPAGYDPHKHYPLLVLLHGLSGYYATDADAGQLGLFKDLDAIVVMPEGGSGWYTDWYNDGQFGGPDWETYELDDVVPTIMARYPILPQRRYHALAGISMGGLGAAYLGGRLPGFFGAVAPLSGFVDPSYFAPLVAPAMGFTSLAQLHGDFRYEPVAGAPDGFYFEGHDPPAVAANLRQTRVFLASGTGALSDAGIRSFPVGLPEALAGSLAEGPIIHPMNDRYYAALVKAGVQVTYRSEPGGHDWADFAQEIKAMLRWGLFRPVAEAPATWTNDTVATHGDLWGFDYRFAQPPTKIVRFDRAGSKLQIGDAGSAVTLMTAAGCVVRTDTPATVQLPSHGCPTVTPASRGSR